MPTAALPSVPGRLPPVEPRIVRPVRPQRQEPAGQPYDGHTLAAQVVQTERLTGIGIERAYVDRGYRGHDADRTRVILSGQKRGVTPVRSILRTHRERRRRAAIEPVIGHMKADCHLGRNSLLGAEGDAANLVLAAAGHNLRPLRAWLARLFAFLLSLFAATRQTGKAQQPRTASI